MKPPMTPDTILSGYMIKRDNIQSNTIQHNNTRDKLFFSKEKWAASGGILEPTTLCSLDRVLFHWATEAAQVAWLKSTNTTQYTRQSKASQQPVLIQDIYTQYEGVGRGK